MTAAPLPPELQALRARMDAVNERLRDVLQERARLAAAIGAWKRARGLPLVDPAREAAMLAALVAAPGDGFSPAVLAELLRAVFAASRALVERGPGAAG